MNEPLNQFPLPLDPDEERLVHRRRLPNGRTVEWVRVRVNDIRECGGSGELESVEYPSTDCGCAAHELSDVYSCSNADCKRTICGRHCRTCSTCGLNYCTACLSRMRIHGRSAIVCKACEKELKRPGWLKFLRKVFIKQVP